MPGPVTVRRLPALLACLVIAATAAPVAAQTVVTTCGQETHGAAVLNADLDCTGFAGYALTMHGGTLAMNGFTIRGGLVGVHCDLTCKILGPGTITETTFAAVNAVEVGLKLTQVNIVDNPVLGIQVWNTAVVSGPAVFSGNGTAIRVGAKAKLANLTISGNFTAVEAANNAHIGNVWIQDSTVSGNRVGLEAQRNVRVVNSVVTGNATFGIYAHGDYDCDKNASANLVRSTVSGNGTDPECGASLSCADVATCDGPRIRAGSTCGTSYQLGSGNPGHDWNVCSLD